jgi:inosine-uridine nucleoside N-ribohydrolase
LKKTILLDTDAGVDDILALLLLLRCPDFLDLAGITVVAGNTHLDQCLANVRRGLFATSLFADGGPDLSRILLAAGAEEPLARPPFYALDVHGPDGLGGASDQTDASGLPLYPEAELPLDPRPAHDLILDLAAQRPGEVTVLAIGPLTNLALAHREDPERFRMLREVVIMGGAFRQDGNTTPRSEFNIHVDPEAAQEVLLQERLERVELGVRDGFRRLQCGTAREHGEAGEEPPLLGFEQLVAPFDRHA